MDISDELIAKTYIKQYPIIEEEAFPAPMCKPLNITDEVWNGWSFSIHKFGRTYLKSHIKGWYRWAVETSGLELWLNGEENLDYMVNEKAAQQPSSPKPNKRGGKKNPK